MGLIILALASLVGLYWLNPLASPVGLYWLNPLASLRLPVLRRIPHRLVGEVVDQRENNRVRERNDQSGAAGGETHQDARRQQNEKYGNEEAHPDVHRYTSG